MNVANFQITRQVLILFAVFSLSGCAAFETIQFTNTESENTNEISDADIETVVKEWQETKSDIQRISALEQDMALIVEEMNKLAKLGHLPPSIASEKPVDFVEADKEEETFLEENTTSIPVRTASERQGFAVHIALFLNTKSAERGWQVIQKRYPALFNGITPYVSKVQGKRRTMYSLRVGPYKRKAHAITVCAALMQNRYRCNIVDNIKT
ncbi:SPOR domain-containing protein [Aestuariibacter sp. AA17]|uniref:SPOR domain-containing protein n=1 Tax=Fluctibacter corallii TaxID=2984329 RepID=A0ABT3AB59_9ALTE|nr:SPOR domain-containing protein [Aestuariibacter sp. AA17]MCV2885903.1 SPOR domain-containing protein [Aestuariibacter sp. AA17]